MSSVDPQGVEGVRYSCLTHHPLDVWILEERLAHRTITVDANPDREGASALRSTAITVTPQSASFGMSASKIGRHFS